MKKLVLIPAAIVFYMYLFLLYWLFAGVFASLSYARFMESIHIEISPILFIVISYIIAVFISLAICFSVFLIYRKSKAIFWCLCMVHVGVTLWLIQLVGHAGATVVRVSG
ncbi:hypothetical protein [Paenibacillus sp. BC26]|uniref:hypothetical protein n=1 Tax=Paenibacillus sp. BC26 TaxID=1881032 RepID=UPI0008E15658|nr:hypothetical protein [Paenibacillus sp. BC26]SFS51154.1 hypothetical protein SAMN05428962_0519 [Paenibacillus sp. BC26]